MDRFDRHGRQPEVQLGVRQQGGVHELGQRPVEPHVAPMRGSRRRQRAQVERRRMRIQIGLYRNLQSLLKMSKNL